MVRKSDPAILEIGRFNSVPTIDDLQGLTIEPRDIDDLKECVAGDCKVKLSAGMIERFQNEIDWTAPDYRLQVTRLVIAINHILIYKREQTTGRQILVVSKQIYANHYLDSSLAVTAFGNTPSQSSGSYLFYENRSRIDGLTGLFGKIKRGVIEDQAVDNLKTILEKSKASLSARMSGQPEAISALNAEPNWRRWTTGVIQVCLWIFLISAFIMLLVVGNYDLKSLKPRSALPRLASANTQTSNESHRQGRGTR